MWGMKRMKDREKKRVIAEKIRVEKIVPGGQGLGTMKDGRKVFLWNVLEGEEVEEFEVIKEKTKYLEGVATKLSKTSERRCAPRDEWYLATSPWQIMNYETELAKKREIIAEVFRQEKMEEEVEKIEEVRTDGKEWGYRNKMEYALYWDNEEEKIFLAFRARGTHRKIALKPQILRSEGRFSVSGMSSLERPEIAERALKIVQELNDKHEEARKYQSLLLRANQKGEVAGGLLENGKTHPKFENLTDEILGREYSYSPNGFFQINLPVYKMALREIMKHVEGEKVLDLYAGVGTIGLSVAGGRELVLVETNGAAYKEMKKNCEGVSGAKPVLAKSEEALEYIEPEETVIVDPPRAGCDKRLIEKLIEVKPRKIIYLSCNPATQARDVRALVEAYEIEKIVPFNFFPKTPHVENLVVMRKK